MINVNIAVMYDKNQLKFKNKVADIKRSFEDKKIRCNFFYLNNLSHVENLKKFCIDIYVILYDNLIEIEKCIEKFNIKDKEKLFIITENLSVAHILGCVDITNNLIYFRKDETEIMYDIINSCNIAKVK